MPYARRVAADPPSRTPLCGRHPQPVRGTRLGSASRPPHVPAPALPRLTHHGQSAHAALARLAKQSVAEKCAATNAKPLPGCMVTDHAWPLASGCRWPAHAPSRPGSPAVSRQRLDLHQVRTGAALTKAQQSSQPTR